MPDSRTITLWLTGDQTPHPSSIEVSEPDDDGDLSLQIYAGSQSKLLLFLNPDSARRLAIAILEAAQ